MFSSYELLTKPQETLKPSFFCPKITTPIPRKCAAASAWDSSQRCSRKARHSAQNAPRHYFRKCIIQCRFFVAFAGYFAGSQRNLMTICRFLVVTAIFLSAILCRFRPFCRLRSKITEPTKPLKSRNENRQVISEKPAKPAQNLQNSKKADKKALKNPEKTDSKIYIRKHLSHSPCKQVTRYRVIGSSLRSDMPLISQPLQASYSISCYNFFTFGFMEGLFHGEEE